jgi:hypothetical protein
MNERLALKYLHALTLLFLLAPGQCIADQTIKYEVDAQIVSAEQWLLSTLTYDRSKGFKIASSASDYESRQLFGENPPTCAALSNFQADDGTGATRVPLSGDYHLSKSHASHFPKERRAEVERAVTEILNRYRAIANSLALPQDDLAVAAAIFVAEMYSARFSADVDPAAVRALADQMRYLILSNAAFRASSEKTKRALLEQLAYWGAYSQVARDGITQTASVDQFRKLRHVGDQQLRQFLKLRPLLLTMNARGLKCEDNEKDVPDIDDPWVLAEVALRDPGTADPMYLLYGAIRAFDAGDKNKALFLQYAAQLRSTYAHREIDPAKPLMALPEVAPTRLNIYAQRDVDNLSAVMDEALRWDESTFEKWKKTRDIDEGLAARREIARRTMRQFVERLQGRKDYYEAEAAKAKPWEEGRRREVVPREETYSTRVVRRAFFDQALMLPVNYLTPDGKNEPVESRLSSASTLSLRMFLPEFRGYARHDLPGFETAQALSVNIGHVEALNDPIGKFEAFLSSNPPVQKFPEGEAYVFDRMRNKMPSPAESHFYSHVFKGTLQTGRPAYMSCSVDSGLRQLNRQCEVSALNKTSGLTLNMAFNKKYATRWLDIADCVDEMVDGWLIASSGGAQENNKRCLAARAALSP